MQIDTYLKKYQPIIYQTFVNSLQKGALSHAYLLSGQPGTPLFETAKYLAKSIICDSPSPLACNNCVTCLRIDDNNYPDFIVYDGASQTIKKDEVTSIETQFDKTPFESKGVMIYILNLVENMTPEAVNSMLKFLEEPGSHIYAFLTTNNESSVLPTIISRCQLMRLKLLDRELIIKESIEKGIQQEDAELLSYFYNDSDLIINFLKDKEEKDSYQEAKEGFLSLLEALEKDNRDEAVYICETNIIPQMKSKEATRLFLDILIQAFEDMISIKHGKNPILKSQHTALSHLAEKMQNAENVLLEILKCRNLVNLNANNSLLIDHLIFQIIKE
ncbi:MAG TPA: hypothetical protein PKO28_01145 [Bacilli bacterium]|mgnify:CR=1 FL=1|nr:hypothetical protein [Bacilli bacterium]HPS18557.1 hypothetical protein [Bacilli bacterium]